MTWIAVVWRITFSLWTFFLFLGYCGKPHAVKVLALCPPLDCFLPSCNFALRNSILAWKRHHRQLTIRIEYLKSSLGLKVGERTALSVLKSMLCNNRLTTAENYVGVTEKNPVFHIFSSTSTFSAVKDIYSRLTSKVNTVLSQTFNHKICLEYAIRSQLSAVSF